MLSVSDVAKRLKLDKMTVRLLLRSGEVTWGTAVKLSTHYLYIVYDKKFEELFGGAEDGK